MTVTFSLLWFMTTLPFKALKNVTWVKCILYNNLLEMSNMKYLGVNLIRPSWGLSVWSFYFHVIVLWVITASPQFQLGSYSLHFATILEHDEVIYCLCDVSPHCESSSIIMPTAQSTGHRFCAGPWVSPNICQGIFRSLDNHDKNSNNTNKVVPAPLYNMNLDSCL